MSFDGWGAEQGDWGPLGELATYQGVGEPGDDAGILLAPPRHQLIRGAVSATVDFEPDARRSQAKIIFGRDPTAGAYFAAGFGGYEARFAVDAWDAKHKLLRPIATRGSIPGVWPRTQELTVHIRGLTVTLSVNEAEVLSATLPHPVKADNQLGLFAWGASPITFRDFNVDRQQARAFVVMQFGGRYDIFYREVIKPLESATVAVTRVDEYLRPGDIPTDIESGISEADVVIAEVTPDNPNVFYELGYAIARGKPTVLLAERGRQLPFDVLVRRTRFYESSRRGRTELAAELRGRVNAALGF